MEDRPHISVVVPVFNSAETLPELFLGIREAMAFLNVPFEALFVDDSSTDRSWSVILDLKKEHGDLVRGFRLARNSGQQAATYCGLLQSRGQWVVTLDDDLQPHPREIIKLWQCAQEQRSDILYGVYAKRKHGLVHRAGSRLFRMLLRRVAPAFPDGSSFRLIRSEVLQSIATRPGPWVLVDPVLAWQTSHIATVPVEHSSRRSGQSGYSLVTLVAIAWTLLITYSKLPLHLMTIFGFLSSIISFALGLYYLFQKLMVGAPMGFSALIVTITFSSGLILLSLGMIGEYISRIHTMGSGEPAFTIKAMV
jgi:undecaprenyl-phosphate 4-deoxy-4-formamido-L-arabinose transferase